MAFDLLSNHHRKLWTFYKALAWDTLIFKSCMKNFFLSFLANRASNFVSLVLKSVWLDWVIHVRKVMNYKFWRTRTEGKLFSRNLVDAACKAVENERSEIAIFTWTHDSSWPLRTSILLHAICTPNFKRISWQTKLCSIQTCLVVLIKLEHRQSSVDSKIAFHINCLWIIVISIKNFRMTKLKGKGVVS